MSYDNLFLGGISYKEKFLLIMLSLKKIQGYIKTTIFWEAPTIIKIKFHHEGERVISHQLAHLKEVENIDLAQNLVCYS